jgi:hypothetical protein
MKRISKRGWFRMGAQEMRRIPLKRSVLCGYI